MPNALERLGSLPAGTFLKSWIDFLFPKTCGHCGDPFRMGLSNVLCRGCFDSLRPYPDPTCEHCGIGLPAGAFEGSIRRRCRDCGEEPGALDWTRSFGPYEGPVRIAHHAFKFMGMEKLKRDIAARMAEAVPADFWQGIGALVPVPLSPERKRERGYNPSLLLAAELARKLPAPCRPLLRKTRSTRPQMSLARKERFQNPKGAYRLVEGEALPERIILVDDVYTTGATLEECAEVLKKGGALWVGAVVFGRTPHHATTK